MHHFVNLHKAAFFFNTILVEKFFFLGGIFFNQILDSEIFIEFLAENDRNYAETKLQFNAACTYVMLEWYLCIVKAFVINDCQREVVYTWP